MTKLCKLCGEPFQPNSARQLYCNKPIRRICKVCNKEFETTCNPSSPDVCSRKCASDPQLLPDRVCIICGDIFKPKSARQRYCKHLKTVNCVICGAEFEIQCGDNRKTCSNVKCTNIYAHERSVAAYEQQTRLCVICNRLFVPLNNTQKLCLGPHYKKCECCGKQFLIDASRQETPRTCSLACANQLRFASGNPFTLPQLREKAKATMLARYGVLHPMQSAEIRDKIKDTYKNRTGFDHPSHNPEVRSKAALSRKNSSFELRMKALFDEYNISYQQHYTISNELGSHEFDFYLPQYKFLIDCDGVYYHSYLDDPDGKHVLDYYDEDRLALIPPDHIFHVVVEGQEEKDIKYIADIVSQIDSGVFDYEGELFKWCRSIEFPYPNYDSKRIQRDYAKLCNYPVDEYHPSARLGSSAINQFHKSIYDAHVGNCPSPLSAWYDDTLLKKVIRNRLIYMNNVDPFKIMKGFNISKICPRVSIFNPVLARYLTTKYLAEFDIVFDPFSGFSGRLLGVTSCNKQYIGQDLNNVAIDEARQLAQFLQLTGYSLDCKDVTTSSGSYPCLLTCPPYAKKEIYNSESVFKSCDEWIDLLLENFDCARYVFVVDETTKYSDYVTENIKSTSHFSNVVERVIVIDKH